MSKLYYLRKAYHVVYAYCVLKLHSFERRLCHFRLQMGSWFSSFSTEHRLSSLALQCNHCAHLQLTTIQYMSTRLYTVLSRLYTVLAFLPSAVSTTTFFAGGCSDVKGRTFGTIVAQKLAGETPTMSRTEEKLSTSCRVLSRCTRERSSS